MAGVTGANRAPDTLKVKTFGGFSLEWQDRQLLGGVKTRDSYFTNFMEAVLHSGRKGIGRKQLQDILFEDRDLSDAQHTMRIGEASRSPRNTLFSWRKASAAHA